MNHLKIMFYNFIAGYECKICGKLYGSRGSLWSHMKLDCDKQKTFCCETCNFKTNRKYNLKKHMQSLRHQQSENGDTNKLTQ